MKFKSEDGETIKGKTNFMVKHSINSSKLANLLSGKEKGSFMYKGTEWKFYAVFTSTNVSHNQANVQVDPETILETKETYSKVYDLLDKNTKAVISKLELIYSTITNRLILTRTIS